MVPGRKRTQPEETPVEESNEADLFDEEMADAKSLSDVAEGGGGQFEGELAALEALANEKLLVKGFRMLPSTFREGGTYVCFQARMKDGGRLVVCNTNAMVPVKTFAEIDKDNLPFKTEFYMREPKKAGGKPYWDMRDW